jgi:hypothetical protein
MPPPRRSETDAWDLGARVGGLELVADVDPDRAVSGQLEQPGVGRVDLDVEADAHPGDPAGHACAGAGRQASRVEVVDVEVDRRPAPDLVGVREHLEDLVGSGHGGGCRGPVGHATRLP